MEWRTIEGFDDYEVSNTGIVRSKERIIIDYGGRGGARRERKLKSKVLAPCISKGYPMVSLTKNSVGHSFYVHKLVITAFVGQRPDGMECRHVDGDRMNPNLNNLAWGTPSENQRDREFHGTGNQGSKHPMSKLTELQVMELKKHGLRSNVASRIIRESGIAARTLGSVLRNKRWVKTNPMQFTVGEDGFLRLAASSDMPQCVVEEMLSHGFFQDEKGCWVSLQTEDAKRFTDKFCLLIER